MSNLQNFNENDKSKAVLTRPSLTMVSAISASEGTAPAALEDSASLRAADWRSDSASEEASEAVAMVRDRVLALMMLREKPCNHRSRCVNMKSCEHMQR